MVTAIRVRPEGGEADSRPLAVAELEAEDAVGEHGEEHQPAGDHGLDERERRERERGHVEDPGAERHEHADREPLALVEADRAAQRVAHGHVRSSAGAAVLQQEAEVRREGAEQRQQDAKLNAHRGERRRCGIPLPLFALSVRAACHLSSSGRSDEPLHTHVTEDPNLGDNSHKQAGPLRRRRRRDQPVRLPARFAGLSRRVPHRRRHRPLHLDGYRRAPGAAGRALRAGVGHRLGGAGQRAPAVASEAALPRAAHADLRRGRGVRVGALEARRDRGVRARAAGRVDRRQPRRGVPRVGRGPRASRRCSSRPRRPWA